MMNKIILASSSPRRKQLLAWADVDFDVLSIPTEESAPAHLSPGEQTVHIARNKALAVQQTLTNRERPIVAADTVVVLHGRIIGKPANKEMAIQTLEALSAQTHDVITGVFILAGNESIGFYETTKVDFHELSRKQIEYYVERYKPFDKAGAYGIQEWIGVIGVKAIRGDFYNVMGLPVSRVVNTLAQFKQV